MVAHVRRNEGRRLASFVGVNLVQLSMGSNPYQSLNRNELSPSSKVSFS